MDSKLIPFSPQNKLYQYLRFNSGVLKMKNGAEYIQKNRQTPQRSYKYDYRLSKINTYKLIALLFNPELFYLPLWDQKQLYNKQIEIGDTYISNTTSIDDTDILYWWLKDDFVQVNGEWYSPDSMGDYFPPNGQPRQGSCIDLDPTDLNSIDTDIKARDIIEMEVIAQYRWTSTGYYVFSGVRHHDWIDPVETQRFFWFPYTPAWTSEGYVRLQIGYSISMQVAGLTNGNIYRFLYQYDTTTETAYFYVYDLEDNLIGSANASIPYLSLPDANIALLCSSMQRDRYSQLSKIYYYYGKVFSTRIKTAVKDITYRFEQEVGKYIIGSDGSILEVQGTIQSTFWSISNEVVSEINSTGYRIADGTTDYGRDGTTLLTTGAIIRQDPDYLNYALCSYYDGDTWRYRPLDYQGQCQFPAKIIGGQANANFSYMKSGYLEFPVCPEMDAYDLNFALAIMEDKYYFKNAVSDYENKHFLFANIHDNRIKNLIAFNTARSAVTDPTLEEVISYDPDDEFTTTDYDYETGQFVLVYESADNYELMTVDSIVGNKVIFTAAFTKSFNNPLIIPVFEALILGNPTWTKTKNPDLLDCSIDFMLIKNLSFDTFTPEETYGSVMVLMPPNYYSDKVKSNTLDPKILISDNQLGNISYVKNFLQSVNVISWGFRGVGRTEIANMLKKLNYLNGQQRSIWIPTLERNFEPFENITDVQTVIDVQNKGLSIIFESSGLNRNVLLYHEGIYYIQPITSITEIDSNTERLTLTTTFGINVDITTDSFFICWLFKGRLNSDQIDIEYSNDQATSTVNFREVQI